MRYAAVSLVAFAILLVLPSDSARGTSWDVRFRVEVETLEFAPDTRQAQMHFNVDSRVNYNLLLGFLPPGWDVARDEEVPNGSIRGRALGVWPVNLLGYCGVNTQFIFLHMVDASTNVTDTVTFGTTWDDLDGNTLLDGVDRYPDFLNELYPGLRPVARLWGDNRGFITTSAGEMIVQFLVLEKGAELPGGVRLDASAGTPFIVVVHDPTHRDPPKASLIAGICAPFSLDLRLFDHTPDLPWTPQDDALPSLGIPTEDGNHRFGVYMSSRRDADDDGNENKSDSCALIPDPDWSPYGGDMDGDGDWLGDACDPTPNVQDFDEDDDGRNTWLDNCTLAANEDQADVDRDDIGDACDPEPETPTGHFHDVCVYQDVVIGAGGPASARPTECPPVAAPVATPTATAAPTPSPAPTPTAVPTTAALALPGTGGAPGGGGLWWLALVAAGATLAGATAIWGRRWLLRRPRG